MSNIGNRPDFIIIDEAGEVTEGMYKTILDSKPESVSVPETRQQRRARERREAKQKAKQLKKYRKDT